MFYEDRERYYWTYDSWGTEVPPENYEDICGVANKMIDDYADQARAEYLVQDFSERLWAKFASEGEIGGVRAIYEGEGD